MAILFHNQKELNRRNSEHKIDSEHQYNPQYRFTIDCEHWTKSPSIIHTDSEGVKWPRLIGHDNNDDLEYYHKVYQVVFPLNLDSDPLEKQLSKSRLIEGIRAIWEHFNDEELFESFRCFIGVYDGCKIWIHKEEQKAVCAKYTDFQKYEEIKIEGKEIMTHRVKNYNDENEYNRNDKKPYEIWQDVFDGAENVETEKDFGFPNPLKRILHGEVDKKVFLQAQKLLKDSKFSAGIREQRGGKGKAVEEVYKPPASITEGYSEFKTKNGGKEYADFKKHFRELLATDEHKAVNDLVNCTRAGRWLKKECYENILELPKSTFMKIQKESNPATKNTRRR